MNVTKRRFNNVFRYQEKTRRLCSCALSVVWQVEGGGAICISEPFNRISVQLSIFLFNLLINFVNPSNQICYLINISHNDYLINWNCQIEVYIFKKKNTHTQNIYIYFCCSYVFLFTIFQRWLSSLEACRQWVRATDWALIGPPLNSELTNKKIVVF